MNWQEVCEHPSLRDLPFKIELNEKGEIGFLLRSTRQDGKVLAECAIQTAKGTKVADVAWASEERFERIKNEIECSIAPEVCIEVLSLSNTVDEIQEKRQLYFANGAREVWTCQADGDMHFYTAQGRVEQSLLFPGFPRQIKL